jgi:hypothetical protein
MDIARLYKKNMHQTYPGDNMHCGWMRMHTGTFKKNFINIAASCWPIALISSHMGLSKNIVVIVSQNSIL